MNPTSEASPISVRLVCRVTRLWGAVADATRSAHVAECDACQRYFARVSALSSALRVEANLTHAALDPAATQRTCRAVHAARGEPAAAPRQSHRRREFPILAGLTAAAALAVMAILLQPERGPDGSISSPRLAASQNPSVSPEAVLLVEAMQTWSEQWAESVVPSAGELAANNLLQAEMNSVYADARAALDFLALNFLPVGSSASESEPTRKSTG